MATSQVSEHPLFTGLRELIVFFPKPGDENDFKFCRWQKDDSTRCGNPRADNVRNEAMCLWSEIEQKKDLDVASFYAKSFEEWKGRHCASTLLADTPAGTSQALSQESSRALKYDPDEASEPETPETEMFDPSVCSDSSPVPTPLTEPDSVRTPIKLPASILDLSMPDTQPDIADHAPVSTTEKDKSAVNAITKEISTLSLGSTLSTPNKSSAGGKPAIAESISGDGDASFNGMPEELSIITCERSVVDQDTTVVSTWEEKAPKLGDDPLGQQIDIKGIGIARPSQRGTLHHISPIIEALRTPPTTGKQRKHGIVYVLRSTSNKGIFKIGWSEKGAEKRHNQPKNCYGKDTEIIYESSKPFAGAQKAEQLAHRFLASQNILIIQCEACGKGHREWFEGEETIMLATLQAMEDFLQMPAYELKAGQDADGEMTLSQEAEKRVQSMFNISVEGLRGSTIGQKEPVSVQEEVLGESIEVDSQTTTQTTAPCPQVTADTPIQSTEVDPSQKSDTSGGVKFGRFWGNLEKGFEKFKDTVQNMRSRESTPNLDGFQRVPKDTGAVDNFTAHVLWVIKSGEPEAVKENGSPWDSLVQAVEDRKEKFKEDFAKGRREAEGMS